MALTAGHRQARHPEKDPQGGGGRPDEPDPKCVKLLCEGMGLTEESKGLESPVAKEEQRNEDASDDLMEPQDACRFRALAARANCVARVDVHFSAKEAWWHRRSRRGSGSGGWPGTSCSTLATSSTQTSCRFSRMGGVHFFVKVYEWRSAGGGRLLSRGWSSTHRTVATSSGESELHALVKAAAEGLGFQSLAIDLGIDLKVQLWVDSSAAKSIASRRGLRKTKQVAVKNLWVQGAGKDDRFTVKKVAEVCNPADILTKPH